MTGPVRPWRDGWMITEGPGRLWLLGWMRVVGARGWGGYSQRWSWPDRTSASGSLPALLEPRNPAGWCENPQQLATYWEWCSHNQNGEIGKFKQADKPKPSCAPWYATQKCMQTNSFKHTDKNTEAQILALNAVIQVSDWILPPCQPHRVTSEQSNTQVHKHTYTVMQTHATPPCLPKLTVMQMLTP